MKSTRSRFVACLGMFWVACVGLSVEGSYAGRQESSKRPVTVADSIQMTRLADPSYILGAWAKPRVAEFSPDGKQFVIVLRKGNLENNTNEYSLLLFETATAFDAPSPKVLLTLASSSNRPAIQNVTWLEDSDTVVFLGERPGENQQLYRFRCKTRELKKLTRHPTNVVSYSISRYAESFAFAAEKPIRKIWTQGVQRDGLSISTQWLADLIAGEDRRGRDDIEAFVQGPGSQTPKHLEFQVLLAPGIPIFSLSPDGRYLAVITRPWHVPESWKEYKDDRLQGLLRLSPNALRQYTFVDTQSGESAPLIDAPLGSLGTEVAWARDSRSLVVTDVYLPLDLVDAVGREIRRRTRFVVEVRIPSREIVEFPDNDLRLLRTDTKSGRILFQSGRLNALLGKKVPTVAYGRVGAAWKEMDIPVEAEYRLAISLDEDLNTPPQIFVRDPKSGRRSLLLDLNPQLSTLSLARVEHVRWKATDGHDVDGGLYLPPDYVPGKKYPLILQTHGFNPQRFWMDGPWTTAFAAQALANKGFVVLQVPDWPDLDLYPKVIATQEEGPYQMSSFEGAIDYLDHRGLIDRDRVGIIGFSRSGFYVTFALTHSKYRFAAAAIADGTYVGYFSYLLLFTSVPTASTEDEHMVGALPFGEGLSSWLKLAPGFNLHKVRTPIRIEALGRRSLPGGWEWFAGLSRLGKPVELIYQPDADHIIDKPWERLVSQQGNVEWFSFWLKGEENPDPAKAEQYARWRELRKHYEQDSARPN